MRKKEAKKPVACRDNITREDLPLPIVHYPGFYGTFFAFAESDDSENLFLCSCAREATANALEFRQIAAMQTAKPAAMTATPISISRRIFPRALVNQSLTQGPSALRFRDKLCHRCNLRIPSLAYCVPMYGSRFIQTFGWYINQARYRLGIERYHRHMKTYYRVLTSVCPATHLDQLREIEDTRSAAAAESHRLLSFCSLPRREDILAGKESCWNNVSLDELKHMLSMERKLTALITALDNKIENETRDDFGFHRVGEGWITELLLYRIVEAIFRGEEIIRHHRPPWLGGLELDIYVPKLQLGFEYQGEQHYLPIDAWGGSNALDDLKRRDKLKAKVCAERGVRLICVAYTDPITEEYVRSRLSAG